MKDWTSEKWQSGTLYTGIAGAAMLTIKALCTGTTPMEAVLGCIILAMIAGTLNAGWAKIDEEDDAEDEAQRADVALCEHRSAEFAHYCHISKMED